MSLKPNKSQILKRKGKQQPDSAQVEVDERKPACIKKRYQGKLSLKTDDDLPLKPQMSNIAHETTKMHEEENFHPHHQNNTENTLLLSSNPNIPTRQHEQMFIYNKEHQNYLKIVFNRRKWGELMKKNCQRLYEYLEKNIDDQYYMAMRFYNEQSKIEGCPFLQRYL
jgi:hypothetical protein